MLQSWVEAGQDEQRFWAVTPRYAGIVMEGAVSALRRDRRAMFEAAYLGAQLTMVGYHKPAKFPKQEKVLGRAKSGAPRRAQAPEEMKGVLKMIAAAFGGDVQK